MRNHSDIALAVFSALRAVVEGNNPFPVAVGDAVLEDQASLFRFIAAHAWLSEAAKEFLAYKGQDELLAQIDAA